MKFAGAPLIFLLTITSASAQTSRIERPFFFETGAFLPDNHGTDFPHDLGIFGAFGYSFYQKDDFSLNAQIRGAYHLTSLGGAPENPPDGSLTLSSAFVNLLHRHHGTGLFTGLGIGVGRANVEDGRGQTGALFAAEIGYDLTKSIYLSARYQTASEDKLRGAMLGLGFKF